MRYLSLENLESSNDLLRRDYTSDFRGSSVPSEKLLNLTEASRRDDAFASIREALAVSDDTLREIYTSVVDGKHILLYGPPGTGKTTLAGMIATKLFNCEYRSETAVADWTSFETVGGLQLVSRDGQERLEPVPGVVTEAVVACLNRISDSAFGNGGRQGTWLVLDELNRANMDAAFGQFFTALDQEHRGVSLPFFDEPRRHLTVPRRFRIVGTMNTYDRNFLFRLSYALTRRFALIPIDVPKNDDEAARREERDKLWQNLQGALQRQGVREAGLDELQRDYEEVLMEPLYDVLVSAIRESPEAGSEGLGRGLGFAQIATAFRHAVLELELDLVRSDDGIEALDRGVRSAIVPQLEGLSNTALQDFLAWWENQDTLKKMERSIEAVRELTRGANLFMAD